MTSKKCMTRVKMEIAVNYVQFFMYWNNKKKSLFMFWKTFLKQSNQLIFKIAAKLFLVAVEIEVGIDIKAKPFP